MRRALMVLVIATAAFAGQYDILIAHCDPGSTSGVQTNIGGDPFYDSVDFVDCTTQTPTVATMLNYGCVYTWSNYQYQNATQMGNNLADYVDAGGTVVISDFGWTAGWGLQGRVMTDADYAPMTHDGSGAYSYTNLGTKDDAHVFMDGVSSISNIFYWTYVSKEAPADWVADNTSGNILCAVNADFDVAGVDMYPGDYRYWTGDGWVLYNNIIWSLLCHFDVDDDPPSVEDLNPEDGETDVPVDSAVVFHCKDEFWGVDVSTIDFTVKDTTLSGDRVVSAGAALRVPASPARVLPGDLDIDDTDPMDVVCTWTGDDPFYGYMTITCTVAAGLADCHGYETDEDFVWTFDTGEGGAVYPTTWGAIKAGF